MPKFLVEAISQHRMRYVIDCKEADHAADTVVCNEPEQEFSQMHLGEVITSVREISDQEYLKIFDEDNDYLKSWNDEQKFQCVYKVDYKEDWEFS